MARLCGTGAEELSTATAIFMAPPEPFVPDELHGKPVLGMLVMYIGDPAEGVESFARSRNSGRRRWTESSRCRIRRSRRSSTDRSLGHAGLQQRRAPTRAERRSDRHVRRLRQPAGGAAEPGDHVPPRRCGRPRSGRRHGGQPSRRGLSHAPDRRVGRPLAVGPAHLLVSQPVAAMRPHTTGAST